MQTRTSAHNARITLQQWSVIAISFTLLHCSGVKFNSNSGSGSDGTAAAAGATGGDASGQLNQGSPDTNQNGSNPGSGANNGNQITPSGTALQSLRVHFVGPPCIRGTNCLVEFDLDNAVVDAFDFDWHTDDTLYQQPGAPAGYTYGRPGVHYVSSAGHVTFAPGETVKKVYVQNINPDNIQIIIGVNMTNCTFNGELGNCSDYFH